MPPQPIIQFGAWRHAHALIQAASALNALLELGQEQFGLASKVLSIWYACGRSSKHAYAWWAANTDLRQPETCIWATISPQRLQASDDAFKLRPDKASRWWWHQEETWRSRCRARKDEKRANWLLQGINRAVQPDVVLLLLLTMKHGAPNSIALRNMHSKRLCLNKIVIETRGKISLQMRSKAFHNVAVRKLHAAKPLHDTVYNPHSV
mmetsp:Transcript_67326/g.117195  ORF Transcript_67326/g.117195 Transcript_67326/m.117195 type:complete len:208 (+) Transcript_67326:77-700(+)